MSKIMDTDETERFVTQNSLLVEKAKKAAPVSMAY